MLDNIPIGTDMDSQEPLPNYSEIVDDIFVHGKCELCGITLDEVIKEAETDVESYQKVLKFLIKYQARLARDFAKDYLSKVAYEMVEEYYK